MTPFRRISVMVAKAAAKERATPPKVKEKKTSSKSSSGHFYLQRKQAQHP